MNLWKGFRSDLIIRFQRAINNYLEIILSQKMSKNMFWAQNAQIWLFGPRLPQIWKCWFFHFQYNRLTNTLPTSPQTLSYDHFKPSYYFFPLIALKGFLDTLGSPWNSVSSPYRTPCLTTTVIELNFSPTVTYGIVCLWYQFERKRISISDFKETLI